MYHMRVKQSVKKCPKWQTMIPLKITVSFEPAMSLRSTSYASSMQ